MDIYFDESGFTGYNLLDPDQPVFTVTSVNFSPEDAEQMLRRAFPNYQGREFKFSNIVGTRNEQGLRLLGDALAGQKERTFTYVMDKRYAVFAKMVDFLI